MLEKRKHASGRGEYMAEQPPPPPPPSPQQPPAHRKQPAPRPLPLPLNVAALLALLALLALPSIALCALVGVAGVEATALGHMQDGTSVAADAKPATVASPRSHAHHANCNATPITPDNCQTFARGPPSVHNQYLLESYGAVPRSAPLDRILSPAGCARNGTRWDAWASGSASTPFSLGIAPCRHPPHWCALEGTMRDEAPPQLRGTIPCVLPLRCPRFETDFRFHLAPAVAASPARTRSRRCLRNKVLLFLGDSVMRELFGEWVLWLASSVPAFTAKWLAYDFRETLRRTSSGERGVLYEHPLEATVQLSTHDVDLHDHRINLTIRFRHAAASVVTAAGHYDPSRSGLRFWQSAEFGETLEALGAHPASPRSPADGGADAVFASTTFHDDAHLFTACEPGACHCNHSWNGAMSRYEGDAALLARNLTALQRAGTRVVFLSLFARDKSRPPGLPPRRTSAAADRHLGVDAVRAVADHAVQRQLRAAGFFDAGGRLVDQYPLYAAYLSLAASQRATFGASSLHYSATSSADRLVLPDLGAMRVQFSLDALCSKQSWEPPCGTGRDSAPQAELVAAFQPECQCTSMALSTGGRARFCKADEELRTHKTVRVPTASLYVHLVKVYTTNGTAAPSTLARIAATASSRGQYRDKFERRRERLQLPVAAPLSRPADGRFSCSTASDCNCPSPLTSPETCHGSCGSHGQNAGQCVCELGWIRSGRCQKAKVLAPRDQQLREEMKLVMQPRSEAVGPVNDSFSRWGIHHERLPSCTWNSCFNSSLCGQCGVDSNGKSGALRVHLLLAQNLTKVSYTKGFRKDSWVSMRALERDGLIKLVDRAEDACIVLGDITKQSHRNLVRGNKLLFMLKSDHTIGEQFAPAAALGTDPKPSSSKRLGLAADKVWRRTASLRSLGRAMVLTSNWVRQEFRAGFDVSWPLTDSQRGAPFASFPAASRRFLLSFMGSVYAGDERGGYRSLLPHLHDPARGVEVIYYCKFPDTRKVFPALCAVGDTRRRAGPSYDALFNSTFCLVPGGSEPGSTRLAEVMSAGCIPVLVGDDYVPPFAGLLDWSSLALTVCSTCVDAILPRLRAMRPAEVEAMRRNVVRAHGLYFDSVRARWRGVFETLSRRVRCLAE